MHIDRIHIANFRKLHSVRIDLAEDTTILVGANNSGKTSAMVALRKFLDHRERHPFRVDDLTLGHWRAIRRIGEHWEMDDTPVPDSVLPTDWAAVLPHLDLWLCVDQSELHRVVKLIPTLDWAGGLMGVRLRLEPRNVNDLFEEYRRERARVRDLHEARSSSGDPDKGPQRIWPQDMVHFLERRLPERFGVHSYLLDPESAEPSERTERLEGDPLAGLIRIDQIGAQRGLGQDDESGGDATRSATRLSTQLSRYYQKHLDPLEHPGLEDLDALRAIEDAQVAFNGRLERSFDTALKEVQNLGYPGKTDPKVVVSTRTRPVDALAHESAVQYEVESTLAEETLRLPEGANGLGYQNLISMTFRLMAFRDAWMRVGKAADEQHERSTLAWEPIHLVLIEEPETHLHPQVQQVFIKQAYRVLRNHKDLGWDPSSSSGHPATKLRTQMVVSTHSAHVAHEAEFAQLRYFRRVPREGAARVPTSFVVNLSEVFGEQDATRRFVTRYVTTTHCDLFFADAAILVEGAAERILVPHFIRKHFAELNRRYISLLEIGGSHAYRLRSLVETLGLTTLIITDLDAGDWSMSGDDHGRKAAPRHLKKARPEEGKDQETTNHTLRAWLPRMKKVDDLLRAAPTDKERIHDDLFGVRVTYQCPVTARSQGRELEVVPSTFEDAVAFANPDRLKGPYGRGLARKFQRILADADMAEWSERLFQAIKEHDKAGFALDAIMRTEFELEPPDYIREGLEWLEKRLASDGRSAALGESGER